MPAEVRGGWLHGFLPDDKGREWPVRRFPQKAARGRLMTAMPDLCLHTTETDGYIETLRYPSQWQCGEGIIGQHIELGFAGDAVNTYDGVLQQIEMVGRSRLERWLPGEATLGPTVALVAWLHRTGRIRTGLERPNQHWPVVLDTKGTPPATTTYYRRGDGTWRKPGVYGHVEIPQNQHWDPGSFDYPAFFARVRAALGEDDMDPRVDEIIAAFQAFNRDEEEPTSGAGVPIFRGLRRAANRPKPEPGEPGSVPPHQHEGGRTGDVVPG